MNILIVDKKPLVVVVQAEVAVRASVTPIVREPCVEELTLAVAVRENTTTRVPLVVDAASAEPVRDQVTINVPLVLTWEALVPVKASVLPLVSEAVVVIEAAEVAVITSTLPLVRDAVAEELVPTVADRKYTTAKAAKVEDATPIVPDRGTSAIYSPHIMLPYILVSYRYLLLNMVSRLDVPTLPVRVTVIVLLPLANFRNLPVQLAMPLTVFFFTVPA